PGVRIPGKNGEFYGRGEGASPDAECDQPFDEGAGEGGGVSSFRQAGQKNRSDGGGRGVVGARGADPGGDGGGANGDWTAGEMGAEPVEAWGECYGVSAHPAKCVAGIPGE